jgi:hypothetical protein
MARLVLFAVALTYPACAGWTQTPASPPSPWQVSAEPRPTRSFDSSSTGANPPASDYAENSFVTETELLPNGMIGFGMFGEKRVGSIHSRATVRDFTIPRQRKPAVRFSLKF